MIIDTNTGKVLVTKEQLIKDVKEYFNSMSDDELRARVNKEKRRIKRLKKVERI